MAKRTKSELPSRSQEATLAASDKRLQKIPKPDKLEIKEKDRPQKVMVQLDSKTSVMVYPEMIEHARERYRQRYKQSQEQANHQQRSNPNKGKKQSKTDIIYAF